MRGIKNKIIIVTGGSGLLGKSILTRLVEENATCINIDINHSNELDSDIFMPCDITDQEAVQDTIFKIQKKFGRIDGLVNSAYPRTSDWATPFEEISYSSWQKNVDMQLNTVFKLCQQVLPIMKDQNAGSIVNISSIYGVVGPDFSIYEGLKMTMPAAYSAIKGGILSFTKYMASLYGKHNVRVNAVSPGGIFDYQHEAFVKRYNNNTPLLRMGNADEIASPIVFLLSDDSSYITGHNLIVDGGWTAI